MLVRLHALFLFLRRPAIQVGALTLALGAAACFCFEPRFHNNDDVKMAAIASGTGLTPAPDPHLIYTNSVFVGVPLVWLYTKFPGLPWYALYLSGAYAIGMIALGCSVARLAWSSATGVFWALFLIVAWIPFVGAMQFTSAAFSLSIGGAALVWSFVSKAPTVRWRAVLLVVILLLAANAVRRLVFPAALAFAFVPALVGLWFQRSEWKSRGGFLGVIFSLAVLGSLAMNGLDRRYFSNSPGWENAFAYNDLRAAINDYGSNHPFNEVGWTENDYRLFQAFFAWDTTIYSAEKLKTLNDAVKMRASEKSWSGAIRRVKENLHGTRVILTLAFLGFCLAVCWVCGAGASEVVVFAVGTPLAITMMIYLAYTGRLPGWVVHSLLLLAAAPAAYAAARALAGAPALARRRRGFAAALALAALPLAAAALRLAHREAGAARALAPRLAQARAKLAPLEARVFVLAGSGWPLPLAPAFAPLASSLPPAPLVALGPYSSFPPTRAQLAAAGGSNLYLDLLDKPGFFLIVPCRKNDAELYLTFLREHHGIEARAVRVVTTDFSDIYRFERNQ